MPSTFAWNRDDNRLYTYSELKKATEDFTGNETIPCWSVGRLIEIYEACTDNNCVWFDYKSDSMNLIERIIHDIVSAKETVNGIDFSKLEE